MRMNRKPEKLEIHYDRNNTTTKVMKIEKMSQQQQQQQQQQYMNRRKHDKWGIYYEMRVRVQRKIIEQQRHHHPSIPNTHSCDIESLRMGTYYVRPIVEITLLYNVPKPPSYSKNTREEASDEADTRSSLS